MTNTKFDRYDEYKDSGIEWLGMVPSNWRLYRIKDYTYVKGRIGWQGLRSSDFLVKGNFYCVTGTDFKKGIIDWTNCYFVSKERYEQDSKIQLKENDLLITKDGSIGKIALIVELPLKSTLNSGVFVTRPKIYTYSNKYMFWFLNSLAFKNFIDLTKGGSTIQHLYQNVFDRFIYTLPPLPEQTAIANYLDKKTAQIDRKIDLLTQKADRYKELKQSLINETVTRGLDKSVPLKNSGIEWIGKIPEHWEVKRLKDIAISTNGGAFKDDICDSGLPIVKIQQLKSNKEVLEFCNPNSVKIKPSNKIKKGDLVFSWSTLIEPFIYKGPEAVLNQHIFKIDKKKDVSKLWLFYKILQSTDRLMIFAHGSTMKHILKSDFDNLEIETPNYKEQKQIANYLDKKTAQIDKITETINTQIEKLKELRKTLINDVVTGKIKVYKEEAA